MSDKNDKAPRLLLDRAHNARRSLLDAIEIIRRQPGFTGEISGRIWTASIALPTDESGSLVLLHCERNNFAVPLTTSNAFGGRHTLGKEEEFDIAVLNAAHVDEDGNVELSNGIHLHAIRFIPVRQMRELNERDCRIVRAAIAYTKSRDLCYRYVDKDRWPNWKGIDFSALSSITVNGLKDFTTFLQRRYRLHLPEQTVANTLSKCGIRYGHRKF